MLKLKLHHLYKITKMADKPEIAGKVVVFKGYLERSFDIRRAIVRLLNPDGSEGEEWFVTPTILFDL